MIDFDSRSESVNSFTGEDRTKLHELKQNWPVPKCESKRLQVLRELKLLGSTDESEIYNRFTNLANRLFKVPVVLISLIDIDRQWFKAKVGMSSRTELPRKGALCNRILLEDSPMVLATEDVKRDDRFRHCNLLWMEKPAPAATTSEVTTSPVHHTATGIEQEHQSVRFYASVALVVDGMRVGSLSLYDSTPRRDLVDKALKFLPDFGNIISDALERRHKLQLGAGSELAELSMSVTYGLKFPLVNMQQTLAKVGEFTAFQPARRVTRIAIPPPISTTCTCACARTSTSTSFAASSSGGGGAVVTPSGGSPEQVLGQGLRSESLESGMGEDNSGECLSMQSQSRSLPVSPMVATTATATRSTPTKANPAEVLQTPPRPVPTVSTPGSGASSADIVNAAGVPCGPHCIHSPAGKPRHRKIVSAEALRVEKEDLLDAMFELRRRASALIKVLDHSLSLAHALQVQRQHQRDSPSSSSDSSNVVYTSIARKKNSGEDATSKERSYSNQRISNRFRKIYRTFAASKLGSADMTYTMDAVLVHCQENEHRRYQFSSRAVALAMVSSAHHIGRMFPKSRLDVSVRFEERDYVASQLQRLTSPTSASTRLMHSHKQPSPTSSKSLAESSGKQTRLPSFALGMHLGSSSSEGTPDHLRDSVEYNLHPSRRPSIEEANAALYGGTSSPSGGANSPGGGGGAGSGEKRLFPVPSPIFIPAMTMFTSPRTSIHSKVPSVRSLHSAGDLIITFRCIGRSSNNVTPTVAGQEKRDSTDSATQLLSPGSSGMSKRDFAALLDPRVETATFESTVLRSILSTANGGFVSSSGTEFNPDAPTAAGLIGALFAPGVNTTLGTLGMAVSGSGHEAGTSTLPPSLKFNPREMLEEIREDSSGEGEVYVLTIRIPCNIVSPTGDQPVSADSKDSATLSTSSQHREAPRTPHQMRAFQPVVLSSAVDSAQLKKGPLGTPLKNQLSAIPSIRSLATASTSTRISHVSNSSRHVSIVDFGAPSSSSIDYVDSSKAGQQTQLPSLYEGGGPTQTPVRAKPNGSSIFGNRGMISTYAQVQGEGQSPGSAETSAQAALAHRHKHQPVEETAMAGQQRAKPKAAQRGGYLSGSMGLFSAIGQATRAVLSLGGAAQRRKVATDTILVATSPPHD